MSQLLAQASLASDPDFLARALAAAARQQPVADTWAYTHAHRLAASPGFAEKYEYALAAGTEHPGGDEAVIPDADVLAAVAAILTPLEPEEQP